MNAVPCRGYFQPFSDTCLEIADEILVNGPLSLEPLAAGDPFVGPAVAVIIRRALPRHAGQGSAAHAIGAAFIALDFHSPGRAPVALMLGERVIDLPLRTAVTLAVNGSESGIYQPEDFGDPHDRLCQVADQIGGLAAGTLVAFGPRAHAAELVCAGTVELWGPQDSTLVAHVGDR